MNDIDARIAFFACRLCVVSAPTNEKCNAIQQLISPLSDADWMLRDEIENCLVTHIEIAREGIGGYIQDLDVVAEDAVRECPTEQVLRRVLARSSGR